MPALVTVSKQVSQDQQTGQQQTVMVLSYFIDYNNTFYVFHGVSVDDDFNIYSPVFESNMTTFDKLTDPLKLNVKPERIMVKEVELSGTLADAFNYYGVQEEQVNELALLNNMELTDKVQPGQLIKVIGK